jgi:hypothetical protein
MMSIKQQVKTPLVSLTAAGWLSIPHQSYKHYATQPAGHNITRVSVVSLTAASRWSTPHHSYKHDVIEPAGHNITRVILGVTHRRQQVECL